MKYSLLGLLLLLLLSCSQEQDLNDEVELKDVAERLNHSWDLYEVYKNSNPDSALYFMKEVVTLSKVADKKNWLASAYAAIGDVHRKKGDLGESTFYYLKTIKLFKELGELKRMAGSYTNLGLVYESIEDFDQAIFYTLQAKDLYIYEGNSYDKANVYRNLALYYNNLKQYDEAEKHIQLGEKAAIGAKDFNMLSQIYNISGIINFKQENYDKAREYYHLALEHTDSTSEEQWIKAAATNNIFETYFYEKNYPQAEEWLDKALVLKKELNDPAFIQSTLNLYGEMLMEQGKNREAAELLLNNFSQASLSKTNSAVGDGLSLAQEALTRIASEASPENAVYLSQSFAILNTHSKEYNMHTRQLREELQTLSKQLSVQANVEKHAQQEKAEKAAQKTFQIMMVAAFLLISALVAIFMVMAKNRRYKTLYGKVADILNSQALRHMKKG